MYCKEVLISVNYCDGPTIEKADLEVLAHRRIVICELAPYVILEESILTVG
jgi:hypothetical protein